jgi:hypothetical protein
MKTLIFFLLSLSLFASPSELLLEVLKESATTPHAKAVVQSFSERLEAQKREELARHEQNLNTARGGKMIYANVYKGEIQKQINFIK